MTYSPGEGFTPPEWSPVPNAADPGAPGVGAPGVGAPGVGAPGVGAPGVGAPGVGTPGVGTPGSGPRWGSGIGAPPPPPVWQQPAPAHRPGIVPLRPLGVGDIIAATFATLTRSPRQHFGISAAVTALVVAVTMPAVALAVAVTDGEITVESWSAALVDALGNYDLIALALIGPVAPTVIAGAAGLPTSLSYLVGTVRHRFAAIVGSTAPAMVLGLIPVVVGAAVVDRLPDTPGGLVAIIAVSAATMIGVVAGLVRLGQAPAVATTEGLRPGDALRRALTLSGPGFWRYLAVLVLLTLICGVISWVLRVGIFAVGEVWAIPPLAESALTGVWAVIASVTLAPLLACAFAVMGVDARIRREGFQVQLAEWAAGGGR
ncbi:hypothetical protein GYA93_11455 [Gordonia desulfuricans]|uniref:Glycerophosphoryl diester phosphodiesterase membrane domain-containing protein n=1 Tax=Gordonia desulfuricans TaxID=89051 RepID=A0A7K3LPN4_9ACTN|nr:hypothetical protein [Gordonia desulfuricans]NDK90193.1 hypothetical protein [Gordonia desulfuricans]